MTGRDGDGSTPPAPGEDADRWRRALEADTLDAIEKDGRMFEATRNPLYAWRALDTWFVLDARRRDAGLDPLPMPGFCDAYFRVLARRLTDTAGGLDWKVAPEPYGFLASPRKDQSAEEWAQSAASLRRAKERKRIKDPVRAAKLAREALGLWRQGKSAFADYWRSEADAIDALSVEVFRTAGAKLTRAEDGSWSVEPIDERITEPKAIGMLAEANKKRRTRRRAEGAVDAADPDDVARSQRRRVSRGRAVQAGKAKDVDGGA